MPRSVIEKALHLFPNTNFVNAYGLTETSSTISVLGPEDHRNALKVMRKQFDDVYRLLGNHCQILKYPFETKKGKFFNPAYQGEIWVKGEQVSGEYLGHGTKLTDDGWFPTNDGGFLDESGYLFVEGRIDDIIIRGGENISPGEIEETLLTHSEIRDAAAFGIPDTQWGEVIVTAIVTTDESDLSAAEVKEFVKNQLRSSRTPDHVVIVDELPYNETGKLLRRVLRENLSSLSIDEG